MGNWVNRDEVPDMTGMRVRLRETEVKPEYRNEINICGIATGGFGCKIDSTGRAVFITFDDGEHSRWNRSQVEKVWIEEATPDGSQ